MKPITYTLIPLHDAPETYYQRVEELAKEVLTEAESHAKLIIDRCFDERIKYIDIAQACLELLLLGVYAKRGLEDGEHPVIAHLDHVLKCLEQSSDYAYQSRRLREWQRVLNNRPLSIQETFWESICEITHWFEQRALDVLDPYTRNVNHFLSTYKSEGCDRSDALLRTSPRIEYHINMVGAEILNGILRNRFLATEHKLIVLPGCLRLNPLGCQALKWTLGFQCGHCTEGCQISKVSKLGAERGVQVSFVNHQSSLEAHVNGLNTLGYKGDLGILGVACALSLLEGGFMLQSHNVPAQCVPLNYCGCVDHWHEKGISTRVSLVRLLDKIAKGEYP